MRRTFYPQWHLAFDDADFYQCSPTKTISVQVVLGDLVDTFRDLETYGHWLSGWDKTALTSRSEPGDGLEDALRVRLRVAEDLEPSWRVIRGDEDEGVPFKSADRLKVGVSLIGASSDRHLTWSRGSLLGQLTGTENLSLSLAEASRAARQALDARRAESLGPFDSTAQTAEQTARALGVVVASSYKAHLDSEAVSIQVGGLALHDGVMPLRQLGSGSKRMVTTGLQQGALRSGHITLLDEVEVGLEPHRIARLLEHLKADTSGQYLLTTHSPVVLRELTVADLQIVHCRDGVTQIVAADTPPIADSVQGKIRLGAEAFLAPKVIVCEGATEVGLLRALDEHWIAAGKRSFAYRGVSFFDANGAKKIKEIALSLRHLSYDAAVLADSDSPENFSDADSSQLEVAGVHVAKWGGGLSLEERIAQDLPWDGVVEVFERACVARQRSSVLDQVRTQLGSALDDDCSAWTDSPAMRTAVGRAAKAGDWFKRQDRGQDLGMVVADFLDEGTVAASNFFETLSRLRDWIDRA
jgi:hypothetical protein